MKARKTPEKGGVCRLPLSKKHKAPLVPSVGLVKGRQTDPEFQIWDLLVL